MVLSFCCTAHAALICVTVLAFVFIVLFFWFVCLGLYGNRGILPAKNVLEKGLLFVTYIYCHLLVCVNCTAEH